MVGSRREISGRRLEIGASPTMGRTLDGVTTKEAVVAAAGGGVVGEATVHTVGLLLLHGVDEERYQAFHLPEKGGGADFMK